MSDELIRATIAGNPALKACGQNYPEIERLGNAPTEVANPDAGQKTAQPVTITLDAIWAIVPSAERVKARREPGFVDELRDAIAQQNRPAFVVLLEDAVTAGAISSGPNSTAAKLQTLLTATTEITAPAKIAGPSIFAAAGLPRLTAADIQGVDNRLGLGGNW